MNTPSSPKTEKKFDTCDSSNKEVREIWVTGTLRYGPIKLMTLNSKDAYEAYIAYVPEEEGILLVTVRHGRRQRRSAKGQKMFDKEGKPMLEWCKITLFTIIEDLEQDKDVVIKKTYTTGQKLPEKKDRDDWRSWIYHWYLPNEEADELCVKKLQEENTWNDNILKNLMTHVDMKQQLKAKTKEEFDKLENAILELPYDKQYETTAKLRVYNLIEEGSECNIPENYKEIIAPINGFNFSEKQLSKKPKVIGAAAWVDGRKL